MIEECISTVGTFPPQIIQRFVVVYTLPYEDGKTGQIWVHCHLNHSNYAPMHASCLFQKMFLIFDILGEMSATCRGLF